MLKKILALSLVLTVTLFVGLSYAGHRNFGRDGGSPGCTMLLQSAKEIGLEEAQIDKIKRIHLNAEKEVIKSEVDLRIAELELREMMSSDSPDKAKINRKIDEVSELRAKVRKIEAGATIDAKSVLTTEQKGLFKEWMMKRVKERRSGHGCCQLRERGLRPGMGKMEGWRGPHLDLPPPPYVPEPIKGVE